MISDVRLLEFAQSNGCREVHRSWRDTMLIQGRHVDEDKIQWETLSALDRQLDTLIAFDVIKDFIVWYEAHSNVS